MFEVNHMITFSYKELTKLCNQKQKYYISGRCRLITWRGVIMLLGYFFILERALFPFNCRCNLFTWICQSLFNGILLRRQQMYWTSHKREKHTSINFYVDIKDNSLFIYSISLHHTEFFLSAHPAAMKFYLPL